MLRLAALLTTVMLVITAGQAAADDGAEDGGGGAISAAVDEVLDGIGVDGTGGDDDGGADPVDNGSEYVPPYTGPSFCSGLVGCIFTDPNLCANPDLADLEACQGDDPEPVVDAVPAVDPWVLARRALDQVQLATADIRLSPGPPNPTYPTIPTWVWVPRDQWQMLSLSVSAGATTVYVEARPVRMELDSGERSTMKYSPTPIDSSFVCGDAGRVWRPGMGEDATTCSYTYATTSLGSVFGDDRYHVTGQIIYDAAWTCVGQCSDDGGSLGEVPGPTGEQGVEVVERQSVVTRS